MAATVSMQGAAARLRARTRAQQWFVDPAAWVDDCVEFDAGTELTAYQRQIMDSVARNRRVAVRGPRGLGKSANASLTVLWFALTREMAGCDWKVVTTAGGERQLTEFLWPEIRKWAGKLRWDRIGRGPFTRDEMQKTHISLQHGLALGAVTSPTSPGKIEGAHADHILYVFDEAKSINDEAFDAAEGALTSANAFALMQSTPGGTSGRFYDIHDSAVKVSPRFADWSVVRVTREQAIAAGRMPVQWAEDRARQWGVKSALYQQQVLGEFAVDSSRAVIPLAWVEAAVERWHVWRRDGGLTGVDHAGAGRMVFGVDVARQGSDDSVLAVLDGSVVTELVRWHDADLMSTAHRIMGVVGDAVHPQVVVDADGLGAGVHDRLMQAARNGWHGTSVEFHGGESAVKRWNGLRFANNRSAAWFALRDALDPNNDPVLALPDDPMLIGDLTAPEFDTDFVHDRVAVERKDQLRPRLGRSPDAGDAVVMAWWGRLRHARVGGPEFTFTPWGSFDVSAAALFS